MPKYTKRLLRETKRLYNENFAHLLATVNTLQHNHYVKIERQLNQQELAIRRELENYVDNVCPTQVMGMCEGCSGYYRVVKKNNSLHYYNLTCSKEDEGATLCVLKNV